METGIYMIRNKINDKKYIGQAVDIDKRWREHIGELNDNNHHNRYLQRAWNKYGDDNFEFTIVCLCEEEELDEFEIDMIAHFDTYNNGYNLTLGGDGARGYKYTDEQRDKISEAKKEYYKDPENRKKKSEAMNRPEVKAKMSEARKEYYKDPENIKKMSEAIKEAMNRPEVKKKHREAMNRPEVKKKRSEALKGKGAKAVYCVNNDTVYAGVVEAGEKIGIDPGCISWCCQGKNITKKYPGGHHIRGLEFWYLSEYEEKFGKVAI